MRFPRMIVALVACLCSWTAGYADGIDVKPEYEEGELIVARIVAPVIPGATAEYKWTVGEAVDHRVVEGGLAIHGASKPGRQLLAADAEYTLTIFTPDPEFPDDPTKAKPSKLTLPPYRYTGEFVQKGTPGPEPEVKKLAELAGKDAQAIGSRLTALSNAVKADGVPVEAFPQALALSLAPWDGNPALPVITARVSKLTDLAAIAKELDLMVAELGSLPPPVVTVGARRIVILHETNDDQPEDAALYVTLQNGAVAAYAKEKGHLLDILDDDPDNQPPAAAEMLAKLNVLGVPPPALFILDKATGSVIHKQPRPATADEILTVVKTYGG